MICTAAFIMVSSTVSAAVPHKDEWDVSGDLAGWRRNTIYTDILVVDTGGNPNGYLFSQSTGSFPGPIYYAGACTEKAALTGDFGFASTVKVSVDLNVISNTVNFNAVYLRFRYHDSTYNGWRILLEDTPTYDTWVGYSVEFDPTWSDADARAEGWVTDQDVHPSAHPSQPFATTMGDVYTTEIRFESSGYVVGGIDNFELEAGVPTTDDIDDYIQNIPNDCFKNNPGNRKNTFHEKLDEVQTLIDNGEYQEAINQLQNDIRAKADGSQGGNPNNDWITCEDAQAELCAMIDALIAYLQTLL
jgi:hypothetical protein